MLGRKYVPVLLKKGQFTMDSTVEEMKDHSLLLKIMYKAVELIIAKGFGGKADYENPEFRMLMASSVGSPSEHADLRRHQGRALSGRAGDGQRPLFRRH